MRTQIRLLSVTLLLAAASAANGASLSANFDDGKVPAGTAVFGSAVVESTGGFNNSGTLKLTKAVNSQTGSFIIEDLDSGVPVYGVSASFKVRIGGGTSTPADGFSFSWATDLPDGTFAEEGAGSGLTVGFDIYDNGGGEAPAIDIKFAGATLATAYFTIAQITTTNQFENVTINLRPDGMLDLTYKGAVVFTNLPITGFSSLAGARFGFGARTGGSNANQFIDTLQITTALKPQVGIVRQPVSRTVMAGAAVIKVQISNPDGVTFQWFRNGTAISGATTDTLTLNSVTVTDSGSKFKVDAKGPNNTVTSQESVLTVVPITVPTAAKLSLNFNNGTLPANSAVFGNAQVASSGGANNSGVLILAAANNNESGSFIVNDLEAGAPVTGFTASFKMRVGGGTTPPADGFSFSFANDFPDDVVGDAENGAGTGLTVGFNIYNNGGREAPSVDVKYGGKVLASTLVPLDFLETGDLFVPVIVQVKNDGTLDVVYNGIVLYRDFVIEGFASIAGGRFAWAARTGGLNENQFVDDITLTTSLVSGSLHFARKPSAATVLVSKTATFSVEVNNPVGVSYQWLKNGSPVAGANSASFTTAALTVADDQSKYKVTVTGPNNAALTSEEVTLTVIDLQAPASPKVSLNFDNGLLPANSAVFGTTAVDSTGGVNGSGVLKLTVAENNQNGAFVLQPLDGGAEVASFTVAFRVLVGGGTATPADGFSFNFASDFPSSTIGDAENGSGTGITVAVDIYDNGGGEAPSIDVKYGGNVIASTKYPISFLQTGDAFVEVLARLNQDGTFDLAYNGQIVHSKLALPNFKVISNGRFAWAARTGGANENHWVDDIRITTTKPVGPIRIVQQPQSTVVLTGKTATFSLLLSDPTGATYQWLRNGAAIAGATGPSYNTAVLTTGDDGAKFSVRATSPVGTVTSQDATLTVVNPVVLTNPKASFNFNDGSIPAGSETVGSAMVDVQDGVGGSGVLKLTTAENSLQGAFIVGDLDAGKAVSNFTATFKVRIGGGTVPPADGFSFVWANDLAAGSGFGEDGGGSGLVVSFDIYDGGGEAPAMDVRYGGQALASTKVPISRIETGTAYVPVVVRVEADGTFDLIYNDEVIYFNLPLPGFAPMANGQFAFGARTGGLNENQWIDDIAIATGIGGATPKFAGIRSGQGTVIVEWTGAGILQAASSITGPWSSVANATSPHTATATEVQKFFRLVAP